MGTTSNPHHTASKHNKKMLLIFENYIRRVVRTENLMGYRVTILSPFACFMCSKVIQMGKY